MFQAFEAISFLIWIAPLGIFIMFIVLAVNGVKFFAKGGTFDTSDTKTQEIPQKQQNVEYNEKKSNINNKQNNSVSNKQNNNKSSKDNTKTSPSKSSSQSQSKPFPYYLVNIFESTKSREARAKWRDISYQLGSSDYEFDLTKRLSSKRYIMGSSEAGVVPVIDEQTLEVKCYVIVVCHRAIYQFKTSKDAYNFLEELLQTNDRAKINEFKRKCNEARYYGNPEVINSENQPYL